MDPAHFYGRNKHVNPIPGDGFQSDDELASDDSDTEYVPPRKNLRQRKPRVIISETESDSSDEPKQPKTKKKAPNKTKATKINWVLEQLPDFDMDNFKFTGVTQLPDFIENLETPADFFNFLFSNELIETIVEQSNLKSLQDNINKPANITKQELEQFIGMVIFMSIVKLPASRLYWNKSIGQRQIYETMTCNRFETIKSNLHFNDNNHFILVGNPGYDKLFKVRPLLEGIRKQLLLVPKEEFLAVDEQIIPTKVRHDLKQYNPAKPHKWGYKNQVLSGVSGFSYDFDIFAGDQSNTRPENTPDLGVSGRVSRDGTPLSTSGCSSPVSSNPGTPTCPKMAKKNRARHQDLPLNSVRLDCIDHIPEWQKNRQKCQVCGQKTYTKCRKCNVFLCYNDKRNCLSDFHI